MNKIKCTVSWAEAETRTGCGIKNNNETVSANKFAELQRQQFNNK
jgi:hypothetical protein